mgnify:CR=1 FL=1
MKIRVYVRIDRGNQPFPLGYIRIISYTQDENPAVVIVMRTATETDLDFIGHRY